MSVRRLAALRAMAAQDTSPHERDIARAKLRAAVAQEVVTDAFGDPAEHERIAARVAREREEAKRAELVRRWERGAWRGVRVRAGAAGVHPRYGA